MENKRLLSIIIPVHNTKNYLKKCIDSVLAQRYQPIEIILVDDGSTDGAQEICDEYAQDFPQIKVVHQENGGQTKARKFGIELAKGKYIMFVDCDDWIETDLCSQLMKIMEAENADIVTSGLLYEWTDKVLAVIDAFDEAIYESKEIKEVIVPKMMYHEEKNTQGIIASLCAKIFNAQLLKTVVNELDENLTLCEDGAFVYTLLLNVNKIVITHGCYYHYIQHNDSTIHSYKIDNFEKIKYLLEYLERLDYKGNDFVKKQQIAGYVGPLLDNTIEELFHIRINPICCIPPFELIKPYSKVVLYGAGKVGESYRRVFGLSNYAKIVMWLDKKFNNVDEIVQLEEKQYDYVLIALSNYEIADEVKNELIEKGVPEEKIIWKKTIMKRSYASID